MINIVIVYKSRVVSEEILSWPRLLDHWTLTFEKLHFWTRHRPVQITICLCILYKQICCECWTNPCRDHRWVWRSASPRLENPSYRWHLGSSIPSLCKGPLWYRHGRLLSGMVWCKPSSSTVMVLFFLLYVMSLLDHFYQLSNIKLLVCVCDGVILLLPHSARKHPNRGMATAEKYHGISVYTCFVHPLPCCHTSTYSVFRVLLQLTVHWHGRCTPSGLTCYTILKHPFCHIGLWHSSPISIPFKYISHHSFTTSTVCTLLFLLSDLIYNTLIQGAPN